MKKIYYIFLGFLLFTTLNCRSKLEYKIDAAIREDDYVQVAILCTNYTEKRYKQECAESFKKADGIIQEIISQKVEFPFTKLVVEEELNKKIIHLLEINFTFSTKYASIWKETVEIKDN